MDSALLDKHIQLIYSTVTAPDHWVAVLASISQDLRTNSATLNIEDLSNLRLIEKQAHGMDLAVIEQLKAYYGKLDLWVERLSRLPRGRFYSSDDAIPLAELKKTEFYEFCAQSDVDIIHATGTLLVEKGGLSLRLALQRGKSQKPFSIAEIEYLNALAPHLQQAAKLSQDFVDKTQYIKMTEHVIHTQDHAIILLNGSGVIEMLNAPAENLLRSAEWLSSDGGFLKIRDHQLHTRLMGAVRSICRNSQLESMPAGNTFLAEMSSCKWLLEVNRLEKPADSLIWLAPSTLALLTIRSLNAPAVSARERLMQLFKFTATEADIAIQVAEGLSPEEISHQRHRSVATVRTQIKQLMGKASCRRSAELVAIVNKLSI